MRPVSYVEFNSDKFNLVLNLSAGQLSGFHFKQRKLFNLDELNCWLRTGSYHNLYFDSSQ